MHLAIGFSCYINGNELCLLCRGHLEKRLNCITLFCKVKSLHSKLCSKLKYNTTNNNDNIYFFKFPILKEYGRIRINGFVSFIPTV